MNQSHKKLEVIDFTDKDRTIRISKEQEHYWWELTYNFEHYWNSVFPINSLIDCSTPRYHVLNTSKKEHWLFNGLPESVETIHQYIELLKPNGKMVFDLGGYSGLSTHIFSEIAENVICVEPDPINIKVIKTNLKSRIELVEKAAWSHLNGIEFISEGNLGSSAFIDSTRGNKINVRTITLSELAKIYMPTPRKLCIKVDIEGAETEIFKGQDDFLKYYSPRLLIEAHRINGELTTNKFRNDLEKVGYNIEIIDQIGSHDPLILATK